MKILLSPAKTLDFEKAPAVPQPTEPLFAAKAAVINKELRQYSPEQLQKLQSISSTLAELNAERNARWQAEPGAGAQAALHVFQGEVYKGLNAQEWSPEDVDFAQKHLRILSGLYGMLRPTDQMRPYRLEMGTKLKVNNAPNLYHYWRDTLQEHIAQHWNKDELIVNLASVEYYKVVEQLSLAQPVVHCSFKDYSKGKYKVVAYYAKIARGLMARYIVQNRLQTIEELQSFSLQGYYFSSFHSTPKNLVFLRDEDEKQAG